MTSLPVFRAKIEAEWIDYNGHLRDAYYALVASFAIDEVMDHLGMDAAYRESTRSTLYTLEVHLHYLHEVKSTDDLSVTTLILDFDRKRIQAGCVFRCPRVAEAVATAEMMLLHVNQRDKPASSPFPADVAARLGALKASPEERAAFGPGSRAIELKRR